MLIPTTSGSALFLLVISLICLGSWANTFKLARKKWSYELFYIDFAIGALILAVILAYTLGSSGDLPFVDQMVVAGRTAQAWLVLAGFIFNLGNILLLAAVSLTGMAGAFPLAAATALIIVCGFHFGTGSVLFLICGAVLMIFTVLLTARACGRRVPAGDASRHKSGRNAEPARNAGRGIVSAILGGIALGLFRPVAENGLDPEFGVGPYAGVLLFCIGIFCSTIFFHFFFVKMDIAGTRVRFGDYFRGKGLKHVVGLAGGAIFTAGILASAIVTASSAETGVSTVRLVILPLASVLLAVLWGAAAWREFSNSAKGAKPALAFAVVLFACGLTAIGFGLAR